MFSSCRFFISSYSCWVFSNAASVASLLFLTSANSSVIVASFCFCTASSSSSALGGKDQNSGNEKAVERDPTQGIELKGTHTQRVPQRRHRIHVGESEFRETNPYVSFVVCLTTHFSSYYFVLPLRSTWWCYFCVCRNDKYTLYHLQRHYTKLHLC